jgi:hypothetical protein
VAGIGVGEVATEAARGPVQVPGTGRKVNEREAIPGRGRVPPHRTEDAEMVEPSSLATYNGNEVSSDPPRCRLPIA